MTVVTIILGILLMALGASCMFTPFATFLAAGYIIGIMLFVYGIFALVRAIQTKAGALAYVTSILAVIVGFIAVFRPGGTLIMDYLMLIFIAVWFLIQGITSIYMSIKLRYEKKNWGLGIVSGIFGIAAGILSFIYPGAEVFAVGILIGIFLLEAGLNLITIGSVFGGGRRL